MQPAERDALLVQTVARHFPTARTAGSEVELGFGDLRLTAAVNAIHEQGSLVSASLFFNLAGGKLGPVPVFASISGYADSPAKAIVSGGCTWACSFGPLLRAALAGEEHPDVARFEATIHGQRFRIFVEGLDRVMAKDADEPKTARTAAMRERWGASPWLTRVITESSRWPVLPVSGATVLSVFASDGYGQRVVEVKVNGRNWPGVDTLFDAAPPEPPGAITLLREFAVAVPISAPPGLRRESVAATLAGLSENAGEGPRVAVHWRGWSKHGGVLGAPLAPADIERVERGTGRLPDDYRAFLLDVAGEGAGPGYGLLSPLASGQSDLARSDLGAIALAHAGCGVTWLLGVRGDERGKVILDARSSDGTKRAVYSSFDVWYRDWLDSAVRSVRPWSTWDAGRCATASVLSQLLEAMEKKGESFDREKPLAGRVGPGKLALASSGSAYFPQGASLDPCHPCVSLATSLGLDEAIFAPGVAPFAGGMAPMSRRESGGFAGWLRRLREAT